eukprot:Amastigsp_a177638_29.p2 type:complete len:167 gc:universal Amastigsp_a177638_29:885-385(-)
MATEPTGATSTRRTAHSQKSRRKNIKLRLSESTMRTDAGSVVSRTASDDVAFQNRRDDDEEEEVFAPPVELAAEPVGVVCVRSEAEGKSPVRPDVEPENRFDDAPADADAAEVIVVESDPASEVVDSPIPSESSLSARAPCDTLSGTTTSAPETRTPLGSELLRCH